MQGRPTRSRQKWGGRARILARMSKKKEEFGGESEILAVRARLVQGTTKNDFSKVERRFISSAWITNLLLTREPQHFQEWHHCVIKLEHVFGWWYGFARMKCFNYAVSNFWTVNDGWLKQFIYSMTDSLIVKLLQVTEKILEDFWWWCKTSLFTFRLGGCCHTQSCSVSRNQSESHAPLASHTVHHIKLG